MPRETYYVSLFGESYNEAKKYLLFNTSELDVRFLSVSKDGIYLLEVLATESDIASLENLNDVRVFYN